MGFSSTAVLTVLVLVATAGVAEGQQDCVSGLATCYGDLNATTPSASCCNALRSAVSTQLPCLCNLFQNPPDIQGINMTQAILLPAHCGLRIDGSACSAKAPTGSSSQTPAEVGGRDGNGASMGSWIGVPTLLLVSALAFLY